MYPQSKIPLLTQIAHINWFPFKEEAAHLSPDTLIFRVFPQRTDRIIFKVVDYRTKCSTCFSVTCFSATCFNEKHNVKAFFVLSKMLKLTSNYLLVDNRDEDSYYPPLYTRNINLGHSTLVAPAV